MKPIHMKSNLRVADQVRKAINRLNTSSVVQRRGTFVCFDNCREQGFVLKIWGDELRPFHIAFSECRNSDDIVVYCYINARFPQNLPASDEDWSDKEYFPYEQYDQAARYILKRAEEFLK